MTTPDKDYEELKRKIEELDQQMNMLSSTLDVMLEKMNLIESTATGIESNIRQEMQELQELINRNDSSWQP